MQFVRPVDFSKFKPNEFHSQIIAELESVILICTRVPPGCHGPALHTHPADQFYYVTTGEMHIQLGHETQVVEPNSLVMIPEGVAHHNWNEGPVDEVHYEIIVPAPPRRIPTGTKIENESAIREGGTIVKLDQNRFKKGIKASQILASSETGSEHAILRVDGVPPGASMGPGPHIHEFDQIYYVLEGTLSVDIALQHYEAGPNTFIILPAGVVHTNGNEGNVDERHLVLITPHPTTPSGSGTWDTRVSLTTVAR